MIEHVYRRAAAAPSVTQVLVATDDARIVEAVERFGGTARMTRSDHASGSDRLAEVAAQLDCDLVVNVQGDEPLLDPRMVEEAIAPFRDDPSLQMSTLRRAMTDEAEYLDPNVVKVVVDRQDFALYFSRWPIPYIREAGLKPCSATEAARLKPCPTGTDPAGLPASVSGLSPDLHRGLAVARLVHGEPREGGKPCPTGAEPARLRPCPTGDVPAELAPDATVAAQGPTVAAQGPTVAAQGPTVAAQGPTVAAQGPTVAAQGPTVAAQGFSPAYKHVGLYVYRRQFLLTFARLERTPLERAESLEQLRALEHGFRIKAVETRYDSMGVDTPEDLERVRRHLASAPARE